MRAKSVAAVVAGAVVLVGMGGVGGAVGSALITSRDVLDHSLKQRDLTPSAVAAFRGINGYEIIHRSFTIESRDIDPGPNVYDPPSVRLSCPDGKAMISEDTAVDTEGLDEGHPVYAWTVDRWPQGYLGRVDNQTPSPIVVTLWAVCAHFN